MMKKSALLILLSFLVFSSSAQINRYGTPLIRNYSTQLGQGSEQNWWITKDKMGAVYFGNDDKGVIRYDGTNWSNIPVRNNRVRSLGTDKNGTIYVGGTYEFGYLEPDTKGALNYVSLSQRFDSTSNDPGKPGSKKVSSVNSTLNNVYIGEIFSLAITDTLVYFLSDKSLFIYNLENDSLKYINLQKLGGVSFIRIYSIENRIILAENVKGLLEYKNGKLVALPGGDFFKTKVCLTVLPVSEGKILVGTYSSGIFLYDFINGTIDENWISKSINEKISKIYCGAKLQSGDFVIGTLGSGIFVIDKNGKLTGNWTSQNSELQDNIIAALYVDPQESSELWMATAGFNSKAYINLPFMKFGSMSGIEGTVIGICDFSGTTYLATDVGVIKSMIDKEGCRYFGKVEGIDDQTFSLCKSNVGNESFLLAGSINGLYEITSAGKTINIRDAMKYDKPGNRATFNVRSITQSTLDPHRFYIGLEKDGFIVLEYKDGTWFHVRNVRRLQGSIADQQECGNGDLFVFTDIPNVLYKTKYNDTIFIPYGIESGLPAETKINSMTRIGGKIILGTGKGVYEYNEDKDKWNQADDISNGFTAGKNINYLFQDPTDDLWVEVDDNGYRTMMLKRKDGKSVAFAGPLLLLPNVKMFNIKSFDDRVWLAKSKSIYSVNKERLIEGPPAIQTLLTKIIIGRDSVTLNGTFYTVVKNERRIPSVKYSLSRLPEIKYNLNSVSFYWTTPYFINEESSVYSYQLEGFSSVWSKWESIYYKDFTNLPYGKYTFRVKARTATEIESKEAVYEFYVLKPWYARTVMIILYLICVVVIILLIIKAYTRNLKNENIRLEGIVAERTAIVVKQKEELESSIHYASRIQMALLPSEVILSENLKNYFILFKPRDIVSGDFYWMTKKNNRLYVVAADCTGHGVPGAFMSLLGMSFLDEIIDKEDAPRADYILSQLRLHVTESLKQVGIENEAKDGMDMALLVVDFNTSRIEFSGAYNPCFRVRIMTGEESRSYKNQNMEMPDGSMSDGKYLLETIYASKMPIGISSRMNEKFVFFDWALERGISYYLFSDGYIDQFGGPEGRKFMKKNFKRLILEIQDYPMDKQKEILEQNLKSWMGQTPQIDDILVMGIRTE